jgi:hypothetical protein
MPMIISRFTMYHMAAISRSEENQARTFCTIVLWTEEKVKSAKIRQVWQQQPHLIPACLRDDFG